MISAAGLLRRVYGCLPRISTVQRDFAGDCLQSFSGVFPDAVDGRGASESRIGGRTSLFDLIEDLTQFLPPGSQTIVSEFW